MVNILEDDAAMTAIITETIAKELGAAIATAVGEVMSTPEQQQARAEAWRLEKQAIRRQVEADAADLREAWQIARQTIAGARARGFGQFRPLVATGLDVDGLEYLPMMPHTVRR